MYQFMNFCVLMNKSENIDTYVDKIMCTKKKNDKKIWPDPHGILCINNDGHTLFEENKGTAT